MICDGENKTRHWCSNALPARAKRGMNFTTGTACSYQKPFAPRPVAENQTLRIWFKAHSCTLRLSEDLRLSISSVKFVWMVSERVCIDEFRKALPQSVTG